MTKCATCKEQTEHTYKAGDRQVCLNCWHGSQGNQAYISLGKSVPRSQKSREKYFKRA